MYTMHGFDGPMPSGKAGARMRIEISNASPDPIYEQIAGQVRRLILGGELAEGTPLPSIRSLARDLRVSVITTKRAYEELARDGFIDTVGGKGCFVARQSAELLRERRTKLVEDKLSDAVSDARKLGIGLEEMKALLGTLYDLSDRG